MRARAGLLVLLAVGVFAAAPAAAQQKQVFKDWKLSCGTVSAQGASGERLCYIHQEIVRQTDKVPVLSVALRYIGPTRQPVLLLRLPPQAQKPDGVGMVVDKGKVMRTTIEKCDDRMCLSVVRLPTPLVDEMKRGTLMRVAFVLDKAEVNVGISLAGFTAAIGALQETGL